MIIPKPKKYAEKGKITIAPHISSAPELRFCEKAFKRMFKKLYSVNLSEGEDGFLIKLDASLAEEEYRISGREIFAATYVERSNRSIFVPYYFHHLKFCIRDVNISVHHRNTSNFYILQM